MCDLDFLFAKAKLGVLMKGTRPIVNERGYINLKKAVTDYEPKNENEAYLLQLFTEFKPDETVDEQMKELFRWGLTEQKMWQE